jgi:hypothetical protein
MLEVECGFSSVDVGSVGISAEGEEVVVEFCGVLERGCVMERGSPFLKKKIIILGLILIILKYFVNICFKFRK